MTEPADKSSLGEAKALPVAVEQTTEGSRPSSPGSDNDGAERPVREKLKKASIAGLSTHGKKDDDKVKVDISSAESSAGEEENGPEDTMLTDTTSPLRGRPARKRSFDDLQSESVPNIDTPEQGDANHPNGHHKRMRSRDMPSSRIGAENGRAEKEHVDAFTEEVEGDDVAAQKSPGGAGIMVEAPSTDDDAAVPGNQSPKRKRSRDQFDKDQTCESDQLEEEETGTVSLQRKLSETEEEANGSTTNGDKGEPDKKRHRDTSQEGKSAVEPEDMATTVRYDIQSRSNVLRSSPLTANGRLRRLLDLP